MKNVYITDLRLYEISYDLPQVKTLKLINKDGSFMFSAYSCALVERKRGVDLAESEVGTGKNYAYLIAAILAKRVRINIIKKPGECLVSSNESTGHSPVFYLTPK